MVLSKWITAVLLLVYLPVFAQTTVIPTDRVKIREVWDSGVLYKSCIDQEFLIAVAQEGSEYHPAIDNSIDKRVEFLASYSGMATGVDMKYSTRIETGPVKLGKNACMRAISHMSGLAYRERQQPLPKGMCA